MNRPHMNPRIEAMSAAAYAEWHKNLNAPTWERASHMVRIKFYRMIESALAAALNDRQAA